MFTGSKTRHGLKASPAPNSQPWALLLSILSEVLRGLSPQVLHSKLKAEHERQRATQRGREREQLEREKERKLASSAAARERGLSIKDHAKQWAAVEAGDLSSGKYWGGGRSKRVAGSFD